MTPRWKKEGQKLLKKEVLGRYVDSNMKKTILLVSYPKVMSLFYIVQNFQAQRKS